MKQGEIWEMYFDPIKGSEQTQVSGSDHQRQYDESISPGGHRLPFDYPGEKFQRQPGIETQQNKQAEITV